MPIHFGSFPSPPDPRLSTLSPVLPEAAKMLAETVCGGRGLQLDTEAGERSKELPEPEAPLGCFEVSSGPGKTCQSAVQFAPLSLLPPFSWAPSGGERQEAGLSSLFSSCAKRNILKGKSGSKACENLKLGL